MLFLKCQLEKRSTTCIDYQLDYIIFFFGEGVFSKHHLQYGILTKSLSTLYEFILVWSGADNTENNIFKL